VPEENFWTFWCKGRLTEADTDHLAGTTPSGPTSAHLTITPDQKLSSDFLLFCFNNIIFDNTVTDAGELAQWE